MDNSTQLIGASVTHNIHLHGHNPRINVNSTDNSVNIASVSNDKTFVQMREAAQSIRDESEREKILSRIAELESARGSSGFLLAYQNFMAVIADHMTVFGPFIPVLAQMFSSR
jgi:trehalose-6-phosphate synthase